MKKLFLILVLACLSNFLFAQIDTVEIHNTIQMTAFVLSHGGDGEDVTDMNRNVYAGGNYTAIYDGSSFSLIQKKAKKLKRNYYFNSTRGLNNYYINDYLRVRGRL